MTKKYTNKSIFLCTYFLEYEKQRMKAVKQVDRIVAKGKDLESLRNDVWAFKRACNYAKLDLVKNKVTLKSIIIEKYMGESFEKD